MKLLLAAVLSSALCAAVLAQTGARNVPSRKPALLNPINLVINTEADEDDPHSAGNTLYFTSNRGGKNALRMTTRPSPRKAWAKSQPVNGVATGADDKSACFVAEPTGFQYLFFATRHDAEAKNFDLYVAQRIDSRRAWSALSPVHSVCTPEDEMHPWITADRKTLYFSRKTAAGWRIFHVTRPTPNGPQFPGEPKLIEELPPGFHHATLSRDGRTMYLQGPVGLSRWGLFVSTKTDAVWSKPKLLDGLNSPSAPTGDRSPALNPDGTMLYFASDRPGGQGGLDLWVIPTMALRTK